MPDTPDIPEHIVRKARIRWVAFASALVMFLVLMVTGQISGLVSTELTLTSRRVTGKRGLFLKSKIDVPYAEISGVKVKQGLLGKLFDYGTLIIRTKDGARVAFHGIAEPYDIQQQIEELSETAVLGHTLSQYTGERF